MIYSTFIGLLALLVISAMEYRRREQAHRVEMSYLREGKMPPARLSQVNLGWLIAVSVVAIALLGTSGWIFSTLLARPIGAWMVMAGMAVVFFVFAVMLVRIVLRDTRSYRRQVKA